jgi:hypothetical protein
VDLVELYVLVLDLALSGKNKNRSYANFFWGSVGEHVWKDVVARIAPVLHEKGLVETKEAISISLDDAPELFYTANNSRTVAERGINLGWKPSAASLWDTIPSDVELTVSQL